MIVIRMKPRSVLASGTPVRVTDVAHVMCDARLPVHETQVPMPGEAGIWLVDAGSVMSALYKQYPKEKINVIGDTIGWVQRLPGRGVKDQAREWLRLMCSAVFARMYASPPSHKQKPRRAETPGVAHAKGGDAL